LPRALVAPTQIDLTRTTSSSSSGGGVGGGIHSPSSAALATSLSNGSTIGTKKKYDLISGKEITVPAKRPCLSSSNSNLYDSQDGNNGGGGGFSPSLVRSNSNLSSALQRTNSTLSATAASTTHGERITARSSSSLTQSGQQQQQQSTLPNAATTTLPTTTTTTTTTEQPNVEVSNVLRCCICRDKAAKPFVAKCGHICCFDCWSRWLEEKLECPICRERVRLRQLRKMFLT
jgi:hypothetical protein